MPRQGGLATHVDAGEANATKIMKLPCPLTFLASLLAVWTCVVQAGQPVAPPAAGPKQGTLVNSKPVSPTKVRPDIKAKPALAPATKPEVPGNAIDAAAGGVARETLMRPSRPERNDGFSAGVSMPVPPSAAEVRKMIDDFKEAQARFVEEEKALKSKLTEAKENDRALIRSEIQSRREAFLDQQRDAREEIRKRVAELKDRLKDHQEIIDQSKEQARGTATGRKGGND